MWGHSALPQRSKASAVVLRVSVNVPTRCEHSGAGSSGRTAALGKGFANDVDSEVVKVDAEDAHGQLIVIGARVGRVLRRHLKQLLRGRASQPA